MFDLFYFLSFSLLVFAFLFYFGYISFLLFIVLVGGVDGNPVVARVMGALAPKTS